MRDDVVALYVDPRGPYPKLVKEWWDEKRDARLYDGPLPVVAHPPCERWGRYWSGGPSAKHPRCLGADGGCFKEALRAVRKWGGVLEHPEGSHAFRFYGLRLPKWRAGWQRSEGDAYVCCVAQAHYGHRARKLTWLYAVGTTLPNLNWSIPAPRARLDYGFHSAAERRSLRAEVAPRVNATRLSARENLETPLPFAEILLYLAASVNIARLAMTSRHQLREPGR